MRRRVRIDLGQSLEGKNEEKVERQRQRWTARNRNKPDDENPFVASIKPDNELFGDASESYEELKTRLNNLEFGNFPGYFNYRNKAAKPSNKEASEQMSNNEDVSEKEPSDCGTVQSSKIEPKRSTLECGLSDERLNFLRPEWFEDKEVLDIGCNRGHITCAIASSFTPKFILGIDIDPKIIHSANKDLSELTKMNNNNSNPSKSKSRYIRRAVELLQINDSKVAATEVPIVEATTSEQTNEEPINPATEASHIDKRQRLDDGKDTMIDVNSCDGSHSSQGQKSYCSERSKFPSNIFFVEHNYVLARDELVDKQEACFETIICLSVTKWIHLNYRDAGLKRFFRRMYKHLKPGGLLVLEVQPFDNYGRRKKLSDRLRANYYTIKFKPDQFDDYLLSEEVGFRRILTSTTTEHQCAGFKRPLKVFEK